MLGMEWTNTAGIHFRTSDDKGSIDENKPISEAKDEPNFEEGGLWLDSFRGSSMGQPKEAS